MLIRLPPETSLTTPSRPSPLLIVSSPGPLPPLRESTEPLLSRKAGVGWRLSPPATERRREAASERVRYAATAGPVQRAPDSTLSPADANVWDSSWSAETASVGVDAAVAGAPAAFRSAAALSRRFDAFSRRDCSPDREPA